MAQSGNVFVFSLNEKCFWKLPDDVKVHNSTTLEFVPQQQQGNNNLIIGNKSGFIYEIEISE